MIHKEKIPEELINELKTYYKEIDFSNYNGELNEKIVTQKVKYCSPINENREMTYLIRGSHDGTTLMLYAVLQGGEILRR